MKQPTPMTVFVPLTRAAAIALRQVGQTTDHLCAYTATAQMLAAHEYTPAADEEANYAAQTYARVAGLAQQSLDGRQAENGWPLVVAANVTADTALPVRRDADYGAVEIIGLAWDDVSAVFAEDPSAAAVVRAALEALGQAVNASDAPAVSSLDDSLSLPAVQHLLADHEQLWHHPGEDW
jgi:hypothetical protein